jgi:hypothetical protein
MPKDWLDRQLLLERRRHQAQRRPYKFVCLLAGSAECRSQLVWPERPQFCDGANLSPFAFGEAIPAYHKLHAGWRRDRLYRRQP